MATYTRSKLVILTDQETRILEFAPNRLSIAIRHPELSKIIFHCTDEHGLKHVFMVPSGRVNYIVTMARPVNIVPMSWDAVISTAGPVELYIWETFR